MTPDPALDTAIRQARHLLFAFDGPIRSVDAGRSADLTSTTTPHIQEALAACHESGRSAAVISVSPPTDIRAYLDTHDLLAQVAVVAASIIDAVSALESSPNDCLLITSSPADIKAAQAVGTPTIGYARTPNDAAHLVDAGATAFVYSMADIVLQMRGYT
jgi:beta-phosphoglucomutase-like phosphatase (HAD superfamily)